MIEEKQVKLDNCIFQSTLIRSLVDLYSFPGSEFLNREIINQHIDKYTTNSIDPELISFLNQFNNFFEDKTLQSLMIEYARLFVGPFQVVAPPYGSFYLENGRIMGDTTMEVNAFYENSGLSINDTFKDLPDHVVAELEFLIFLIHNELQFIEKSEAENLELISNLKTEFFNKYFYTWFKSFCNVVLEQTESEFYRILARYSINVSDLLFYSINKNLKN